jgi:hypothetical protein
VARRSTNDMQAIWGQGDSHRCAVVTIKLCTFSHIPVVQWEHIANYVFFHLLYLIYNSKYKKQMGWEFFLDNQNNKNH